MNVTKQPGTAGAALSRLIAGCSEIARQHGGDTVLVERILRVAVAGVIGVDEDAETALHKMHSHAAGYLKEHPMGETLTPRDKKELVNRLMPYAEGLVLALERGSRGVDGGLREESDGIPSAAFGWTHTVLSAASRSFPHLTWTPWETAIVQLFNALTANVPRFTTGTLPALAIIRETLRVGGMSREEANDVGKHFAARDREP